MSRSSFESEGSVARLRPPISAAALIFLCFLWTTLVTPAAAQDGQITGRVLDATSLEPLPSVEVFIPELEIGTLTDAEGTYRLRGVPPGSRDVRARQIGYRTSTQSVSVASGETITLDFQLQISPFALDELFVTAAGEQRRRELGNAVSTLDAAQAVENSSPSNFTDLLQGRSTGVSIRRSSGSVGTASSIKIRGVSSISLDNTPLVYVDGARIDNNNTDASRGFFVGGQEVSRLNDFDPDEIESVEVVKGPAAATLYGTEAAAGVIRITTKSGAMDDSRLRFRAETGTNTNVADFPNPVFNPSAFTNPITDAAFTTDTLYRQNLLGDEATTPFRTGLAQVYGGSLQGGTDDGFTYYASGEYSDVEGNLRTNAFEKYNLRGNFSFSPSEVLDVSISNGFTSNALTLPNNDNNGAGYIGVALLGFSGFAPITRSDPVAGGEAIETCPFAFEIAREGGLSLDDATAAVCGSPFFGGVEFDVIDRLINEQSVERYTGSGTVTWRPLDVWTNRFTVGYDQFSDQFLNVTPVMPDGPFGSANLGTIFRDARTSRNLTVETTSTADFDLTDDLNSVTTLGLQYFRETLQSTQAAGQILPAGSHAVNNAVENQGADFYDETKTLGLFIQEQLGWKDRLFITPAVRFDDNSAFGQDLGIQAYPRVSASWIASDEPGFPVEVDQLKLRAAFGFSGKQPGSNDALTLLASAPVAVDGAEVLGVFPNRRGNEELKPERGRELEAGFDLGMLENRFNLEFTYYDQVTNDALVARQLAPSLGFAATGADITGGVFTNIGEIRNRGVEASLDALALDHEDALLNLRLNLSTNSNEVTELEAPIIFGLGGNTQRHQEGFSFGSYFHPRVFIDEDGAVARTDTAVLLGQPTPELEGSFAATLTLFGRVTLYGLLDYAAGHQLYNDNEQFLCLFGQCEVMFESGADGELTDDARIARASNSPRSASRYIEDADYAKIRTVSARLDLPDGWVGTFGASGASLTLLGENLATFTGYSGVDPEVNFAGGANASRAEFLTLPPARRFLAQVQVSF